MNRIENQEYAQTAPQGVLIQQLYEIETQPDPDYRIEHHDGKFAPLRVCDIVTPANEPAMRELAQHVFEVGRAVKAYAADEHFEDVFARMLRTNHEHDDHIPSSIQWLGLRLRQGELELKLTPTEEWLLDPLIRYAHAAGLDETGTYFEKLKQRALSALARAAQRQRA